MANSSPRTQFNSKILWPGFPVVTELVLRPKVYRSFVRLVSALRRCVRSPVFASDSRGKRESRERERDVSGFERGGGGCCRV